MLYEQSGVSNLKLDNMSWCSLAMKLTSARRLRAAATSEVLEYILIAAIPRPRSIARGQQNQNVQRLNQFRHLGLLNMLCSA